MSGLVATSLLQQDFDRFAACPPALLKIGFALSVAISSNQAKSANFAV